MGKDFVDPEFQHLIEDEDYVPGPVDDPLTAAIERMKLEAALENATIPVSELNLFPEPGDDIDAPQPRAGRHRTFIKTEGEKPITTYLYRLRNSADSLGQFLTVLHEKLKAEDAELLATIGIAS